MTVNNNSSSGERLQRVWEMKLLSMIYNISSFPVYLYDTPGGATGSLHLLCRKLKFVVERRGGKELNDYTGRGLKIEAMANVQDVEHYLLKMVRAC